MYLHLGQETVVKTDDIVGIFDIDGTTVSKATRDFLAKAQKAGEINDVTQELPKSFVVCRAAARRGQAPALQSALRADKTAVYISQISPQTLKKRAGEDLGAGV